MANNKEASCDYVPCGRVYRRKRKGQMYCSISCASHDREYRGKPKSEQPGHAARPGNIWEDLAPKKPNEPNDGSECTPPAQPN